MKCPVCSRELVEMDAGDIKVDVCRGGCGGIWFDHFEIKKVDEQAESAGEALLDVERGENVPVSQSARRKCPKCGDVTMMRHFASVKREVEVDECPGCGGFWLDFGELAKIRDQFASEAERDTAADAYFSEVFGDDLKKMRKGNEDDAGVGVGICEYLTLYLPELLHFRQAAMGRFLKRPLSNL